MKEIKAIIQPFMLEKVLRALAGMPDLPGLTVSQVAGWGKSRGREAGEKVVQAGHDFAKKTKIEVVVSDDLAPRVIDLIVASARTGRLGDGKIFIHDVEDAVKIRTGERGEDAV